jgi:hypothetical protein
MVLVEPALSQEDQETRLALLRAKVTTVAHTLVIQGQIMVAALVVAVQAQ